MIILSHFRILPEDGDVLNISNNIRKLSLKKSASRKRLKKP